MFYDLLLYILIAIFVKYTPIYHIVQDLFIFPNCDVIPVNKKDLGRRSILFKELLDWLCNRV